MTISDRQVADNPNILVQKRITELEKANQALNRRKLGKIEAEIALRNNRILKGINRIFSIVVQNKTEEELGY